MLDIKPPEPCGDLMELPDLSVPITVDTESLVQPNRRFTPLDAAAELEGFLNVSSRPRISAGYADIYHGIWTSPQGERIEVAVKEFRALIPRDRQSDPGVLRRRTEIVSTFKRGDAMIYAPLSSACNEKCSFGAR